MTKSPPLRSLKRSSWSPYFSQRPDSCHSSAGMTGGQEHLGRARAVHLLADDALDLLHDAPAERQERVDAGGDLAQVAAAHHEDVRGDLRLGRAPPSAWGPASGTAAWCGERLNIPAGTGHIQKQRQTRASRESRWPSTTASGTSASPASRRATRPRSRRADGALAFVIQKHAATRLHYDFRLELNGVLLELVRPQGPEPRPQGEAAGRPRRGSPARLRRLRGDHPQGPVRRRHRPALGPRQLGTAGGSGRRVRQGKLKVQLEGREASRRIRADSAGGPAGTGGGGEGLAADQGEGRPGPRGRARADRDPSRERRDRADAGRDRRRQEQRLALEAVSRRPRRTRPGPGRRPCPPGRGRRAPPSAASRPPATTGCTRWPSRACA